jgi:prepilin-type N-terminal cleavage/methylation domain-containing protein
MMTDTRTRILREQSGFTLAEVMVTMVIMLAVLFALYGVFDMGLRIFQTGNDKVEATGTARLGMEKMEREIRAAYPVDRLNGKQHVFFPSGTLDPATSVPTLPGQRSITFGNDLPTPTTPPDPSNRKVEAGEAITFELRRNDGAACPNSGTQGMCTVFRRKGSGGTFQPLVESVIPNGLTFQYLRNNLSAATASDGTDIGVVRITLKVNVDGVEQTLTTDVDLRNRGG